MKTLMQWAIRCYKLLVGLLLLWYIPLAIQRWCPTLLGKLEGTFERDLTCYFFVIGRGTGDCRIKNSKIAFTDHGAKIFIGHLTDPIIMKNNGSDFHLWGRYANDNLIDVTCPPSEDPVCKERTIFATIDADTLKLEYNNPANEKDSKQLTWALSYLPALKTTLRK